MISLKRNKKTHQLEKASGKRTQLRSIYQPHQQEDFKISRGKFSDFLTCQRCFYLDRVRGLTYPSVPGWSLNALTDTLLKIEYDTCREVGQPHRLMLANNLKHLIPFQHSAIKEWRNSLTGGLKWRYYDSNIILTGGIDDLWFNTETQEVVIADYKSQQSNYPVTQDNYFKSPYRKSYKVQLDFYAYLLEGMGFLVSKDSYLHICNAKENVYGFYGKMSFDEVLIHHKISTNYIGEKVLAMIEILNSSVLPDSNESCETCAYAHQRALNE